VIDSTEDVIEPSLPIIDPHHHLFDRPGVRYLLKELLADLTSGHNVQKTVFCQCHSMYKAGGPEELRPVGETEFVNGIAAMSASGGYEITGVCAGIVGYADLRLGDRVRPVLEAHLRAGGGRFRGIRHLSTWDEDERLYRYIALRYGKGLLLDPAFRAGFSHLAPLELTFDALVYFHQLEDVTSLARAFPQTTLILDHIGFPIGVGPYEGRRAEVFEIWKPLILELAREENVVVKLGGLGMPLFGFDFDTRGRPTHSSELATEWRPYIETCIEAFGAARCMFESNFPMDRESCSYRVLWNAFKRLASGCSEAEKNNLFNLTASRVYRIEPAR
jgi:predicted TIM-barrel fold metal-dependent hydrolase